MLTERQKQLIEAYLPNPRDPELGDNEYYVLDTANRVQRVRIGDIFPDKDNTSYGVYQVSSGKRIDAGYASRYVGFQKSALYDNKEDCKSQTHIIYDAWEELRELQIKEQEEDYKNA